MKYQMNKILIPGMFLADIIGNAVFFFNKFKKQPKNIKKVLFIRFEHIGDMIMAVPAFESFKKSNPKCEVHVLCRKLTVPLIRNNPNIDKIITYEAPWFLRKEKNSKKLSDLIKELKKEKYDLVFEMHGDPRNNYLAYKTRAYVVGYDCRGFGFFVNKKIKYDNSIHMINQNLLMVKDFCKRLTEKPTIYTDKKAKEDADRIMTKYGLNAKNFMIMNPRSGRPEKDLTDEECAEFINKNKEPILITGSESESSRNKVFDKYKNIINLTGKTNLLMLTELVKKAKKVIAPDTGIVHIAHAVGTPVTAIYKTTDRKRWGYK